jgi:alkylated DNA nucleotide flippase Atl1
VLVKSSSRLRIIFVTPNGMRGEGFSVARFLQVGAQAIRQVGRVMSAVAEKEANARSWGRVVGHVQGNKFARPRITIMLTLTARPS